MRRIALALAAFACASPAFAVQDRYGPPRAETAGEARMAPIPAGSLLDWSGKAAPLEPAAAQRPQPIAPWAQRMAPEPMRAPPPPSQALPLPALTPTSQPAERTLPAPAAQARLLPPPAPPAQPPGAMGRPRFYSVARQFGAQPDPIPVAGQPGGQALTLTEIPASENLGRTQAPLDDGRANQAVIIPETKQNAASNRISRFGL